MRLKAPSAAAEVAGAAGGAALSTVDTALMDGAEGKVCASSAITNERSGGVNVCNLSSAYRPPLPAKSFTFNYLANNDENNG